EEPPAQRRKTLHELGHLLEQGPVAPALPVDSQRAVDRELDPAASRELLVCHGDALAPPRGQRHPLATAIVRVPLPLDEPKGLERLQHPTHGRTSDAKLL